MKLAGKVAIVTGSGTGIGRAIVTRFAQEGAKVVVADCDPLNGTETVRDIQQAGGEAAFARVDVSRSDEVQAMVRTTLDAFGRVDVLINCAGIFFESTAVSTSEADWDRMMGINLKGPYLCMKYCIPEMVKVGGGSIVNIASDAGLVGYRDFFAYCGSKAGVIGLTRATALDFVQHNIRVNALCPGRTATPLVEKHIAESSDPIEARQRLSTDRPIQRMATPDEIAAAVLFLASDEASYAVGSIVSVDGGYTAQ